MKTVLVPVEATEEMLWDGGQANCPTESLTSATLYAKETYAAMLSARPASCALLLEAMEKVIEAAGELQAQTRWIRVEDCMPANHHGIGAGNRLASALSLLSQAREQTEKP
jgi:hypothetical protein